MLTLEQQRHKYQLEFIAGQEPLRVGDADSLPIPLSELRSLEADHPSVEAAITSGLTAHVFKVSLSGRSWTLKRARSESKVKNIDGQTSFLNEVQRRRDFTELKRQASGETRWRGIVDTAFASFRDGVILSPWIDGQHVDVWDERKLSSLMKLACQMWLAGIFEWDLCRGNILFDGQEIRLFDFGYAYRFDPRTQFSSAGSGADTPLFHPAERFESRCYCAHLMELEAQDGLERALESFRMEKEVALSTYEWMRGEAHSLGSSAQVLEWLDSITRRWKEGLRGDLMELYLAECWRSHVLDLDDDLRGKTCTPMTLRRADWLLGALRRHGRALQSSNAFFWGDEKLDLRELATRYEHHREAAQRYQIKGD